MNYKVHFVDDETFLGLPGKDMNSKLGVAYPESGEAYVRKTGSNLVDVFTLAHELEHLEGNDLDEHYDTEHKAFYKDWGGTMQAAAPFAAMIPGVGPLVSAGMGIGGSAMSARNQQKQQQNSMSQFNQQPGQDPGQGMSAGAPNVIQAPGSNMQGGGSGSGGSGLMDKLFQQFGQYSGR